MSLLNTTTSAPAAWLGVGRARPKAGVEQRARPEIVDDDGAVAMGDCRHLARSAAFGKPGDREVRRVDPQDDPGQAVGAGLLEVRGAGAVGGAHLDQPRPGARHHLGDPHAAADLHELAARHQHGTATAREAHGQEQRRGGVGHDEPRLGARQHSEVLLGHAEARAPATRHLVELEIAVARARRRSRRESRRRPRRAPEVGVQDDARGVDHARRDGAAVESGVGERRDPRERLGGEGVDGGGRPTGGNPRALRINHVPHHGGEGGGIGLRQRGPHGRQDALDARGTGAGS
ncbi:MAG: hypothetical protein U0838_09970 [Chloroflexota bacterium]